MGRYDIRLSKRIDFIERVLDASKDLYIKCKKYKL